MIVHSPPRFFGLSLVLIFLFLTACSIGSVTYSDHAVSSRLEMPRIETINKKALVEIKERVTGVGCRSSFLGVFKSGDGQLLATDQRELKTDRDFAKAAANFDALHGKSKRTSGPDSPTLQANNDMLIAPVYQYEEKMTPLGQEVCVTVHGFRGVIKSFEDSDTTTSFPELREVQVIRRKTPSGDSLETRMQYGEKSASKPVRIEPHLPGHPSSHAASAAASPSFASPPTPITIHNHPVQINGGPANAVAERLSTPSTPLTTTRPHLVKSPNQNAAKTRESPGPQKLDSSAAGEPDTPRSYQPHPIPGRTYLLYQ